MEFVNLLQSFGDQIIGHFWLPVVIWTLVAAPIALFLHKNESLQPIYHYHSRTALLLVLPLGVLGAYLMDFISSATQAAGEGLFIVIQNPITVSGATANPSVLTGLSNPNFWIGAVSLIVGLVAAALVLKLVFDFAQLRNMEQNLDFSPLTSDQDLMENLPSASHTYRNTLIAYSGNTNIPFTYGWLTTKIVVPADLKNQPSSLAMAVQHELIHIKNRDFLLNSLLVLIKSLFWFHPLIHNLYTSREEYREVICDSEVLANKEFSQKKYASLLFELAKRDHQQKLVLSMAVNPSSLKKRIQIMSNQNSLSMNFRSSFLITFFAASLLTLTISCTDMSQDGITNSEVEQTQSQITTMSSDSSPLYVVNGEVWDQTESNKDKLSRLKSKYIKSIDVLKGEKATNEYGEQGKNGVLKMTVINPEKAFTDLKDKAPQKPTEGSKSEEGDYFVAVENMPELVGGLGSLQKMINYPEEAREAGAEGRVIVQFIVDKNGNVVNPTIVKGVEESLDNEALRVVKQANFTPGTQRGEPVRVQYSLPITFKLSGSEKDS
ncbi:TonB family protein [Fodinibius sp.]|uniref:TonB family protein n=1 Tax=Fodinibius sp. TaxID=1872440 RepID=UPI002ACD559D|nr:TonB family protein [Fodinibius sp.]MDZ7660681.1 TonB family protein [Fodinibius sp.]